MVETLEEMGRNGTLEGREIYGFTDNMVSEAVSCKGSSSNRELYDLVVRLYSLDMRYKCRIQLIHVAGTRMQSQGTDGLSRGEMYEGVMRGDSMLGYIPLDKSAIEQCPRLLNWIQSWSKASGMELECLKPADWFDRGHDFSGSDSNADGYWMPQYKKGTFLWSPPPGVARFAVEELRQARHKRQNSFHIFVCPRLLFEEWRRHHFKGADLYFELPAGISDVWPASMHETLIFGLYFPYINRRPWELKRTRLLVEVGRDLSQLCKTDHAAAGNLLSELLFHTRKLDSVPLCKLPRMLSGLGSTKLSGC